MALHRPGHRPPGLTSPAQAQTFSDVQAGDWFYELVPIHAGVFLGDRGLLRAFFQGYGRDGLAMPGFSRRAMCYTLLFEFDVVGDTGSWLKAREHHGLSELERRLWGPD